MEGIYMKKIVFTFGRFNPPTTGHLLLANKVKNTARKLGADHKIYGSSTNDKKKNPLSPIDKLLYMKKFLKGFNVYVDKKTNTPFNVLKQLSDQGYTDVTMVVGSDRVQDFKKSISRYVGPDKEYKFDKFNVISAGERDPDAEGVTGMSASKMRAAAADGNFDAFKLGVPSHVSDRDAMGLFKAVRRGMGVKGKIQESWFNYDEFMEFAENYTQLNEEAIELNELSVRARRKMAKAARRTAKLRARKRKIKEKRRKGKVELSKKANKQAIMKVKKKLIRGMNWNDLSFMQREKIDAKVKKKKVLIARISKRLMPNMQKAEQERLKKVRSRMTAKTPAQAIAPANESLDSAFETFLTEAPKNQMATDRAKEKETNRGQGASDPRQRDTARKRGERAAAKVGGKAKWSDLMLVRGRNNKKVMLITAADFHETEHDTIVQKGKVTRSSAGSAAQGDDWKWTETAKSLIHKPKDEVKTKGAKSEQEAGAKGGAKQPETPEQQQASQAQADLASLNVREKEMQVANIEKEFQAQQDAEQQQSDIEAMSYDPSKKAWDQEQTVLNPRSAGDIANSYQELEQFINIYDSNEGKQFEYALTVASDLARGMTIEDIAAKSGANGGKNLGFSKEMFGVAVMTLGQVPEEDRANLYHWDELQIPLQGEPKTDAVVLDEKGDIKYTLSLKNDKGFQIQSGQGASTVAGFKTAVQTVLEHDPTFNSKAVDMISKKLEKIPTKMVSSTNADRLRESGKFEFMFSSNGEIRDEYDYDTFKDGIQKDLTEEVVQVMKDNPNFGMAAIHEAMSGRQRFNEMGVPEAAADRMLSPYGMEDIGESPFNNQVVAKYTENVKCQIRSRSRSGVTAPAVRLDIAKPGIVSKKGKLSKYGSSVIKDRTEMGDEYAKQAGKVLGFSEMFSGLFEQKEEILIDKGDIAKELLSNPAEIAINSFIDSYEFDISSSNPHIDDKEKYTDIIINGKKKKRIPVSDDESLLRKIRQPNEVFESLDESFRMLTEPDVLDTLANRLMSKGMDSSKAYAIATSSLQKRGVLKKGTHDLVDEDYLMALPDYPIQKGELTKNLFDKTLDRDSGWELGDPTNPLELHDPNYKFKDSSLHGKGSFASKDIKEDEVVGLYLMNLLEEEVAYQRTDFCRLTNHSHKNQNVRMEEIDDNLYAVAIRDIKEDEEILMDYFTVFDVVGEETQVIEEVLRWTAGYDDMEIGPDMSGDLMDELQHFIDIGDCPKVYEEGGAGEWGTKKLRDKYIKKTPFMSIDETFSSIFKGV